jgi:hypothetical protein
VGWFRAERCRRESAAREKREGKQQWKKAAH